MGDNGRTLLVEVITVATLADLRRHVLRLARAAGLADGRAQDFAIAVHEAAANAVRHGGGHGDLTVVQDEDNRLVAEIRDDGPGMSPSVTITIPSWEATSGRGLWMARMLTDRLEVRSSRRGTTVRLEMALDRG